MKHSSALSAVKKSRWQTKPVETTVRTVLPRFMSMERFLVTENESKRAVDLCIRERMNSGMEPQNYCFNVPNVAKNIEIRSRVMTIS